MSYEIERQGTRVRLDIRARRPALVIAIDDALHHLKDLGEGGERFEIRVDGQVFRGWRSVTADSIEIRLAGQSFVFGRIEGVVRSDTAAGSGDEVRAEMPGTLVASHVEPGAAVTVGSRLVTIESMKLQVTITAPRAGTVACVHLFEGASFERGAVLVSFEPVTTVSVFEKA